MNVNPLQPPPVPGRVCGECTYCCQYLPVDAPDIRVEPGCLCKFNSGHSCKIYEKRPQVCRDYMCAWRLFPIFRDHWRPDKIGALGTVSNEDIPKGYMQEAIELLLVDAEKALGDKYFRDFLLRAMVGKIPIFFAVPGPPGSFPKRAFINKQLEPTVAKYDEKSYALLLQHIVDELRKGPFTPATYKFEKPVE